MSHYECFKKKAILGFVKNTVIHQLKVTIEEYV